MSFNFDFTCHLLDREAYGVSSLISLLLVFTLSGIIRMFVLWSLNPFVGFSSSLFFLLLSGSPFPRPLSLSALEGNGFKEGKILRLGSHAWED